MPFYIIPAIDIIDGKCVRLTQGDYQKKKIYNEAFLLQSQYLLPDFLKLKMLEFFDMHRWSEFFLAHIFDASSN